MRPTVLSLLCLVCLFVAGCGSGDYQKRLNENIQAIRKNSIFGELSEPYSLPGTTFSLRVPKDFIRVQDKAQDPAAAKLKAPTPLPIVVEESSSFYSYPRGGEGEAPVYQLFVGKREIPRGNRNALNDLQFELRQTFPNQESLLEDVHFDTPAGGTLAMKRLRYDSTLDFVMAKVEDGSLGATKRLPGRFIIFGYEPGEAVVLIIWRVPTQYLPGDKEPETDIDFEKLTKQVCGTLVGG